MTAPTHSTNGATPHGELACRDAAEAIREAQKYDGRMTMTMLRALEPLLAEPIDPKYIKTTPVVTGKPYESTGITAAQVQVDRLNDVLGSGHWTYLTHHTDAGELCRVWALIGNELHLARLVDGQLDSNGAEILAFREGWGGHKRGSGRGDLFKGSETNALKRVLARLGPGCEVYRLDFEDDPTDPREPPPPQAPPTPPPTTGEAQDGAGDAEAQIQELLEKKSNLQELRRKADEGMVALGANPGRRLNELRAHGTVRDLESLVSRVNGALDREATRS